MKAGLYALASLDGAPLDPLDLQAMGFASPPGSCERHANGLAVRVVDSQAASGSIDFAACGDGVAAFLGYLDEPGDLARQLGRPADTPPAELALAALERFGDDAPSRMLGEWSLLRWHLPARRLTLLASEASRDLMYFATDGRRVAVSPELRRLSRLAWVDAAFDRSGLPMQMSRARLRRAMTGETAIRGARRVVPGTCETFGEGARRTSAVRVPDPPADWQGSFDDAVADLEATLRRIVRQSLRRHGTSAFMLSGGLDSSLLAWLASQELGEGQGMFFLTSVATAESGIPDERDYATSVAKTLGQPIEFMSPDVHASVFRPSARMFARAELPLVSARHYLYDAFYDAALAGGANALFDGAYGELTLTNKLPLASLSKSLRQRARDVRAWLRAQLERGDWPAGGFHARLSHDLLASLPPEWRHQWRAAYAPDPHPGERDLWGFRPAIRKNAMTPTATVSASLRHLMPYRDRRLLRLAAAMPARYLHHGGANRALARAMLKDRLPDSVRLRRSGCPISPDHALRLRRQAQQPLERMELYRAAGAGEWLDLEWLEGALASMARHGAADDRAANLAQMTAIAAEFFVWWKGADGA